LRKELKRTESIEDELKRTIEIHSRERNELKTTKEQVGEEGIWGVKNI